MAVVIGDHCCGSGRCVIVVVNVVDSDDKKEIIYYFNV